MEDYPVLTVLPIGMGSCNLIEVYEDSEHTKLKYLAIVDCGSDGGGALHDSFDYILKKMQERHTYNDDCYLDMFLLTHQDSDHWNSFRDFIFNNLSKFTFKKDFNSGIMNNYFKAQCTKINDGYYYYLVQRSGKTKGNFAIMHNYEYYKEISYRTGTIFSIYVLYRTSNKNVEFTPRIGVKINKIIMTKEQNTLQTSTELLNVTLSKKNYSVNQTSGTQLNITASTNDSLIDSLLKLYTTENEEYILLNSLKTESISAKKIYETLNQKEASHFLIKESYFGGVEYCPSSKSFRDKLLKISSKTCKDIIEKQTNSPYMSLICRMTSDEYTKTKEHLIDASYGDAELKNATSATTLWNIGNSKYFLPGDMTVQTMYYITNKNLYTNCKQAIMTAPHHGSSITSRGQNCTNMKNKTADPYLVLNNFISEVLPSSMVISASYKNGYGLPGKEFLKACEDKMPDASVHLINNEYICYHHSGNYKDDNKWPIFIPIKSIFSTYQCEPPKTGNMTQLYYREHVFEGMEHSSEDPKITQNISINKHTTDNKYRPSEDFPTSPPPVIKPLSSPDIQSPKRRRLNPPTPPSPQITKKGV